MSTFDVRFNYLATSFNLVLNNRKIFVQRQGTLGQISLFVSSNTIDGVTLCGYGLTSGNVLPLSIGAGLTGDFTSSIVFTVTPAAPFDFAFCVDATASTAGQMNPRAWGVLLTS